MTIINDPFSSEEQVKYSMPPETDARFDTIVAHVEQLHNCEFVEIAGYQRGEFKDAFTQETVDCTTFVVVFQQDDEMLVSELLLLDGSFSRSAANFYSGWLVFENDRYPEVRFIRKSEEAIEFTNHYTRAQLVEGLPTTDDQS